MSKNIYSATPQEKYNRRMYVWCRTVLLFNTSHKKMGVFCKCGYNEYVIEGKLSSLSRDTSYEPDIIAWARNPDKMLIVELTTNPTDYEKKQQQVHKYLYDCDYADAQAYGSPKVNSADVIITHHEFYQKKPSVCEIAFNDGFKVRNIDKLADSTLIDALKSISEESIPNHAPDTGISIIPEMSPDEIRIGIYACILSLFKPGDNGKTAEELTDLCLERLADKIEVAEKRELVRKVRRELMKLMYSAHEYIALDSATKKFHPTGKGTKIPTNYKAKQAFNSILKDWVDNKKPTLLDWGVGIEDET